MSRCCRTTPARSFDARRFALDGTPRAPAAGAPRRHVDREPAAARARHGPLHARGLHRLMHVRDFAHKPSAVRREPPAPRPIAQRASGTPARPRIVSQLRPYLGGLRVAVRGAGTGDAPVLPRIRARARACGGGGARRRRVRARALRQLGRGRELRVRVRAARHCGDGARRPRPRDQDHRMVAAESGPRGAGVIQRRARIDPRGAPREVRRDPQRHPRARRHGHSGLLRRTGRIQHRRGVAGARRQGAR